MNKTKSHNEKEPIAVDIKKLASMLGCGHATARKIAEEAHAVIRLNRRVLYSVEKVKKYIDTMTE